MSTKFVPLKKHRSKLPWLGLLFVVILLGVPAAALAAPPSPLAPASPNAAISASMFWTVSAIALVVFILVEGLLVFAILRYRRRAEDEMPRQVHGNATAELAWTIVPALLVGGLFFMSLNGLRAERTYPEDAMIVEITGHQWYWEYEYPETEVKRLSRNNVPLYIPANTPVIFEVTSNDVIHSFWVAELAGKMDAVPGHTNVVWVNAEPGTYVGQCAEFCGIEHYAMLFDVEAVSQEEFDAWMEEQVEIDAQFVPVGTDYTNPQPDGVWPEGDPANGEVLFVEQGCTACHSLDGSQLVGPTMLGIGQRAETRRDGYSAEDYIHESIMLPCEYLVSGFTCVMPQNYGTELLDIQDMADITAYLLTQ